MAEAFLLAQDHDPCDEDLAPRVRARSNTWPRLPPRPEAAAEAEAASPPLPPPEHRVAPAARPRAMDVIAEVPQDQDEDLPPTPFSRTSSFSSSSRPRNAWGNASYADLIAQAILSSPERRLTLAQIYRWLEEHVPYFKESSSNAPASAASSSLGWKNSVRHNLSLLDRFVRVQNEDKGQSSWWTVDPDAKPGRGSRTRRRAATTETSKMTAERRGRLLKKAEALRAAKLQAQAEAAARPDTQVDAAAPHPGCPAEQLASRLNRHMALGGAGPGAQTYLHQQDVLGTSPQHSYQPRPRARCYEDPLTYEDALPKANLHYPPSSSGSQPSSRSSSRAPSPPQYQHLPTILHPASCSSPPPYELPTVIPPPSPNLFLFSRDPSPSTTFYQISREASPVLYHPLPLPTSSSPLYIAQPSPPLYQVASSTQSSPLYAVTPDPASPLDQVASNPSSPLYQTTPVYQYHAAPTPSPPLYQAVSYYPPAPSPSQPDPADDDLSSLPLLSADSALNCDVDAVVRQELILEGNLDFNFSHPVQTTSRYVNARGWNTAGIKQEI